MYHIRTTKTSSAAVAVQVVKYVNRKMIILAHIGSAHTKDELAVLKASATDWIENNYPQRSLFPAQVNSSKLISLDKCEYLGIRYHFIYETFNSLFDKFDFHSLPDCRKLLLDLSIIRIIEPASKLRSLELLNEYFGLNYDRITFYRRIKNFITLKDKIETKIMDFAKKEFNFDFSLVFYDVTTLYFETFQQDELRKPGFSKDNKSQQPQILIGLIVDTQGFPVAYEMFEGNKFEGHTLIPIISSFKRKHCIDKLTVVADAAMLSMENVKALCSNGLSYIVGARISNLPAKLIKEISLRFKRKDGENLRIETEHGQLICDFSIKRYRKDKLEMDKQIMKAQKLVKNPAQAKRAKFIKGKGKTEIELNDELIKKTESLLGIKGYYTNLTKDVDNLTIIKQYHNLWHVEQSFRIAKSDLEIRPIFHFKEQTIEAHILICFMALAVCKYMEIKTTKSTKQIVQILRSVTDARIKNTLTGEEIVMRSKILDDVKIILSKLDLSY